jgi:hypothetical protein
MLEPHNIHPQSPYMRPRPKPVIVHHSSYLFGLAPLNTANIGFGNGWSLNLSQYQHIAPRSLILSTGEHYQVSNSGCLLIEDQKLKSFKFQQKGSDFEIIHKDGKNELLSRLRKRSSMVVLFRFEGIRGLIRSKADFGNFEVVLLRIIPRDL